MPRNTEEMDTNMLGDADAPAPDADNSPNGATDEAGNDAVRSKPLPRVQRVAIDRIADAFEAAGNEARSDAKSLIFGAVVKADAGATLMRELYEAFSYLDFSIPVK